MPEIEVSYMREEQQGPSLAVRTCRTAQLLLTPLPHGPLSEARVNSKEVGQMFHAIADGDVLSGYAVPAEVLIVKSREIVDLFSEQLWPLAPLKRR